MLSRKPVAGWDSSGEHVGQAAYRGVKFHVYEEVNKDELRIWTFACIYDSGHTTKEEAQFFIEQKMVAMTEFFCGFVESWKCGIFHACQDVYAPILLRSMQEFNIMDKKEFSDINLELS